MVLVRHLGHNRGHGQGEEQEWFHIVLSSLLAQYKAWNRFQGQADSWEPAGGSPDTKPCPLSIPSYRGSRRIRISHQTGKRVGISGGHSAPDGHPGRRIPKDTIDYPPLTARVTTKPARARRGRQSGEPTSRGAAD